jgi:hypothetical protein
MKVEKKQEKTIAVMLIILIFLLAFFVAYVFYSRVSADYIYEGPYGESHFFLDKHTGESIHILDINATYARQGSINLIKNFRIPFDYGPEELEVIPMENVRSDIVRAGKVYLTRDVYLDLKTNEGLVVAMWTVDRVLGQKMMDPPMLNVPTEFASIEDNERAQQLEVPVITCDQASEEQVVIWFKEGAENKIYEEKDYCIVAEYMEGDDPIKVATKLTYHLVGVM